MFKKISPRRTLLLAFGLTLLLLIGYFTIRVLSFRSQFSLTLSNFSEVEASVKSQDFASLSAKTKDLNINLKKLKHGVEAFEPLSHIPFLNKYFVDVDHMLKASIIATDALSSSLKTFQPLVRTFEPIGNQEVSNEERLQILVNVSPLIEKELQKFDINLKQIKRELDEIDPEDYPENLKIKGKKIRDVLFISRDFVEKAEHILPKVKEIATATLKILGLGKEKTYLIWLQNDKELRATGGFITSVTLVKVKNGKLTYIKTIDSRKVHENIAKPKPPEPLAKYLGLKFFYSQDANLSPDFVESVGEYKKLVDHKVIPQTDGVIAIDTQLIGSLLQLTGPIILEKYKVTLSTDNNELGVPDFVYKLEYFIEKTLAASAENKKILGDFTDKLLEKTFDLPSGKNLALVQTILDNFEKKHILFYSEDPQVQNLLEKLNWSGRVRNFDGDYLHINSSNLPGRKANLFVKYTIEQDIKINKDGEVTKELKITLKNKGKDDKWLNGRYNEWQRVYVPKGSALLDKKYWRDFSSGEELGKTVFRSYTYVRPIEYEDNSSQTVYKYKLPFKLKPGESYKLLIQKQPGTAGHKFIIRVNGKERERFLLTTDRVFKFKI